MDENQTNKTKGRKKTEKEEESCEKKCQRPKGVGVGGAHATNARKRDHFLIRCQSLHVFSSVPSELQRSRPCMALDFLFMVQSLQNGTWLFVMGSVVHFPLRRRPKLQP